MFRCELPPLESVIETIRKATSYDAKSKVVFNNQYESQIEKFTLTKYQGKYILEFTLRDSKLDINYLKSLELKTPPVYYLSILKTFQSYIQITKGRFDQLSCILEVAKKIEDVDPDFQKFIHDFTIKENIYRSDPLADNSDSIMPKPTKNYSDKKANKTYTNHTNSKHLLKQTIWKTPEYQTYGDQELLDIICGEDPGWRSCLS